MDFDRNSMTVPVQSSDYTKKFLQKDSNPTTMEVVTQTNAVKSPTDSPAATKLVYTVEEIARMLAISLRSAYNLCNSTTEFRGAHHLDSRGNASGSGQHGGPHPASGSPPHIGGRTAGGRDRRSDPGRSRF